MLNHLPAIKHLCHFIVFYLWICGLLTNDQSYPDNKSYPDNVSPNILIKMVIYSLQMLSLLSLPQYLCQFLGLILYDTFADPVVALKYNPLTAPFICFRVVTRGDYRQLVRNNVRKHLNVCSAVGLRNYIVEVVTEKGLGLGDCNHPKVVETVLPIQYRPKSGAIFKARVLQYCLERRHNRLADNDWIVHLDEETVMTEASVCGIMNFVCDGTHDFGQGLITYADQRVVNVWTTLMDACRVADDLGKIRFQFKCFHKPLFSWKGTYFVCRAKAERRLSFDHGLEGSVAEDCYFAVNAYRTGRTFDWIEGPMWEESPFTITDYIRQRTRWMQGIHLVVHSPNLPWRYKVFVAMSHYAWITSMPTKMLFFVFYFKPHYFNYEMSVVSGFVNAVTLYMFIFGAFKSFSVKIIGAKRYVLYVLACVLAAPMSLIAETIAVCLCFTTNKYTFYVVKKQIAPRRTKFKK
ncbi:unnamed protein product [Oppiella nova]|uniref:Glycosyltransferase 2-like domain-containing protein n=1 Tax=Oppiella nova TaxID=334625 RepID=A0A7R9MB86_9ACAR|nr:unnamed protein product [Oppiella nova]CAG2172902.1 unnamed protein product [Oppiella nova]